MSKVKRILKKIPSAWQVFIVMVALMGFGASAAGYVGLPSQVRENTESIHELVDTQRRETSLLLRMLCNQDPNETWDTCERRYSGLSQPGN